mgnify:CR=1 FL=1
MLAAATAVLVDGHRNLRSVDRNIQRRQVRTLVQTRRLVLGVVLIEVVNAAELQDVSLRQDRNSAV